LQTRIDVGSELQRYEYALIYQLVSAKRQQPLAQHHAEQMIGYQADRLHLPHSASGVRFRENASRGTCMPSINPNRENLLEFAQRYTDPDAQSAAFQQPSCLQHQAASMRPAAGAKPMRATAAPR